MHIIVDVNKIGLNGEKLKTNDMHLTFVCPGVNELKNVYPNSYKDTVYMCDSKRRV